MTNQHLYCAAILPISDNISRPLWSVMIPTYNCADYLRETLASVLAQDPGSNLMQIEVVDDHSTLDDPASVVEELGGGRVGFYQQPENVGYIKNFETCLQRSRGRLIHLLHGDDCVRDNFYRQMQRAFDEHPEIGAAFCRHIYIDEHSHWQSISELEQPESGILSHWLEQIAAGQRLVTPSMVVQRDIYERLGGFDRRISCAGEDWEMWVRIAAHYPVWYEVEPLAAYRVKRSGSLTKNSVLTGALIRDMRKATEIIESYLPTYLPKTIASQLSNQAREIYACWAIETAEQMFSIGNVLGAMTQIQEALKCRRSLKVIYAMMRIFLKTGVRWIWRQVRAIVLSDQEKIVKSSNINESEASSTERASVWQKGGQEL